MYDFLRLLFARVGEAYSYGQGWVEGALQTADLVLQEHFDMKPPSWLPKDYDFGY